MRQILLAGSERLGVSLSEDALGKLTRYAAYLTEENQKMNLTAISDERDIAERHFLDSLAVLGAAGIGAKGAAIADVGSGAGFPGVPMKIAEPTIRLTAIDSTEKKVDFLAHLFAELGLENAAAVHGRAEELALLPEYREKFDFAVSRAVARLNVLSELCLPFVRIGGAFLAMKTAESAAEQLEAEAAVKILGGTVERNFDYELAGAMLRVVVIRKIAPTPGKYPRRYAKIQKQPL